MTRFVTVMLAASLALAGCQVDSGVNVDVEPNGSGSVGVEVRLDNEAVAALPDLEEQLRVDDLRNAGWEVQGPTADEGASVISATHKFEHPAEVTTLIDQVVPAGGPLQNFQVTQKRSLFRVDTTFSGTADLSRGIDSWADPVLRERVGAALGVDPQELERNLGVNLEDMFTVGVTVDLPGNEEMSPAADEDGQWNLAYGTSTELRAESSAWTMAPLMYFALAVLCIVGAVAVALLWRTYRPKHIRKD